MRIPAVLAATLLLPALGEEPYSPPRCELVPGNDHSVSFRIDGEEVTAWRFGKDFQRPFFHPFNGPSGVSLTRMGHPGAPDHDHHQSIWFAHHIVEGESFWAYSSPHRVEQKQWYSYEDGETESIMSSLLEWKLDDDTILMEQDLVAASIPGENGEHSLEIQFTLRPAKGRESVELEKTNFGLFAVRVAKSISHHFGGGQLRNSEGAIGEPDIFGKAARWMDYSGPVAVGTGPNRKVVTEGITYFDHPDNPRYPTKWHVRSDGWMGASFCFDEGWSITAENPLTLRYLLHAHAGEYDAAKAEAIATAFAGRKPFVLGKAEKSHRHFEAKRAE